MIYSFSTKFITEAGIIHRIREKISETNWKKDVKEKKWKALTEKRTPFNRKEAHSKSQFDTFYKNNDYFIECVQGDEEFCQIVSNILAANFDVKTPIDIFIINGKDFNKSYDLYGLNAYQDDVHHVVIPLSTIKNRKDIVFAKNQLKARYFNDVVDNNEYREYLAGRHKKSAQIQWLIDAYNK